MTEPAPERYTLEDAADDIIEWATRLHEEAAIYNAELWDHLGTRWLWRIMRPLVLGRVRSVPRRASETGSDAPM